MNPGYAGRSNLPDNLKKLFRSMAMTRPDLELISQVMLFSQGFCTAESLAGKVVPLFKLCLEQLSRQPHYDFGLRALKSVLVSAGQIKRNRLLSQQGAQDPQDLPVEEQEMLIQSVNETIVPKLVAEDVPLLTRCVKPYLCEVPNRSSSLLGDVFPGITSTSSELEQLTTHVLKVCKEMHLEEASTWVTKVLQLYQIQSIQVWLLLLFRGLPN
jgi:dynein heavy chain 1